MKKNIVEKIWENHSIDNLDDDFSVLVIDFILLHEVTSAQAFKELEERKIPILSPNQCVATVDHIISTSKNRNQIDNKEAKTQVDLLRYNTKLNKISLYDFESGHQGIVHVIGPELGITQPGLTIICGDSHTATHGAFGALAFGVGTTEVTHALGTGCLLLKKPLVMKVEFQGEISKGVFAKDLIMKLITAIGIGGATGHIIEYCGEIIQKMTMEERMTICNMSIECGAKAGLIAPDNITYSYIKGRPYAPLNKDWEQMISYWNSFKSDQGCSYDKEIIIDISNMKPMVTWGTNPSQAIEIDKNIPIEKDMNLNDLTMYNQAIDYMKLNRGFPIEDTKIDWAFIGSCTNGRIEDLRISAQILKNKKIHPSVTFYIVPGSESILKQAQKEGLDKIFKEAGADFRMPGCSLCLGMNDDKVPNGKRCISSSNRNFMGRQGTGSFTHLASPATVTASAIEGKISSPLKYFLN